jgi:enoyl-CoA hydratase/carnithine racemase
MYTGRVFGAEEAHARGLVSEVLAPDALLPRAAEIARDIADNTAPGSVALNRQLLWRMLGADHPLEAHRLESRASFLEKRPPHFTGKVSDTDFSKTWWPKA